MSQNSLLRELGVDVPGVLGAALEGKTRQSEDGVLTGLRKGCILEGTGVGRGVVEKEE